MALLTGLWCPRRIVNTLPGKIWSLLGLYRLTSARPAGMLYPQHIVTYAQNASRSVLTSAWLMTSINNADRLVRPLWAGTAVMPSL